MGEAKEAISYHQGFYGAAELEFRLEKAEMTFYREYNLSKEPQRIDILVQCDTSGQCSGKWRAVWENQEG